MRGWDGKAGRQNRQVEEWIRVVGGGGGGGVKRLKTAFKMNLCLPKTVSINRIR